MSAWRNAAAYRGEGSYRSWLMRIAWTRFISRHRATQARRKYEDMAAAARAHRAASPDDGIDATRALARLGVRERAAAQLCYGEGYSHGEAAAILGVPLGTLKSLAARARLQLIKHLKDNLHD